MTLATPGPEIQTRKRRQMALPDGYDPLATCPDRLRERWRRKAAAARRGSMRAAVELQCLSCCAWDRPEVKRCAISGCPLYAVNRRIFAPREQGPAA